LLFVGVLVGSLSCDQGTKTWARRALSGRPDIVVVDGFWRFHYAENPAAAFSILRGVPGARVILSVIGVGVLAVVLVLAVRAARHSAGQMVAFGIIAGSAMGNLYDRIVVGRVTDFVVWHWRDRWQWPVFNVADAGLLVGVVLLLWTSRRAPAPPTAP
jgi:signal peptidase II